MSGSVFGNLFTISTWGESHGAGIGVTIDGCPAGIPLTTEDIQRDLDRRRPGFSAFATQRKETDAAEILSGIFEGKTTGTPIAVLIRNQNQRSGDYDALSQVYRPGHADLTYDLKYGFRDYRGGGRSSGRETAGRVAGGAVARRFLAELGISVRTYACAISTVKIDRSRLDFSLQNDLCLPDAYAYEQAAALVTEARSKGDSLGGIVECVIEGLFPGLGEPVFDKFEAVLGQAVLSIGAVKAIEFGAGFASAEMTGSQHNDISCNHAGGLYGGITDGSPVVFRAAFKPTPSIAAEQAALDKDGNPVKLRIAGRHDPLIVPRAVVVVEAMAALTVADLTLRALSSNIDRIRRALL